MIRAPLLRPVASRDGEAAWGPGGGAAGPGTSVLGQLVRLEERLRDGRGRLLVDDHRRVHGDDRLLRQLRADRVDRRSELRASGLERLLRDDRRDVLEAVDVLR